MYQILAVTLLGLLTSAAALSDVYQQCIAENSDSFSNDILVGSWYEMYKFTLFGSPPASTWCTENIFTKPSAAVLAEYKAKYNDPNLPYSLDDNPVIRNDSYWVGMVTGNNMAKFYVFDPKEAAVLSDGYSVTAYRPLGNDYIMWHDCSLRGHTMMLYAKNRYAPVAEMEELIKNTSQLNRLFSQRYCATY